MSGYKEDEAILFLDTHSERTRGNGQKLQQQKSRLDISMIIFLYWESSNTGASCTETVQFPSLETVKTWLEAAWGNLV